MALTNGLVVMTPSTVAKTGASSTATINADGSVTFGSCETLSLNGVFTSAYDNYMIVMRYVSSANAAMQFRMRASGVDNSTANSYVTQELIASSTVVSGARTTSNLSNVAALASAQRSGLTTYVYGPYLAQPTAVRSTTVNGISDARLDDRAFTHNQSASYDGCTFIGETYLGTTYTLSGLVTVFGFEQ
jgi:hypothetical protein